MSVKKKVDSKGKAHYHAYVYDSWAKKNAYLGSFDREKDAREAEYEAKRRLRLGETAKPKPPREELTFDSLSRRWLASRVNIRRSTRVDYEQCLRRLRPYFGKMIVSEITRRDADLAVAGLAAEYSPSTCRKAFVIFSMVMRAGIAWGHLDSLPTSGQRLALPKIRRRRFEPLTPEQVNLLVDSAPAYWSAAVLLLFTVAPRRAELFGITVDDLDLEGRVLTIRKQLQKGRLVDPKSESAVRKVVLTPRLVSALRDHLAHLPASDLRLLFPTEAGHPVDANNWYKRVWTPTREKAGLPALRMHDARAHLASVLLGRGRSVKYVQRTLGHATASVLLDWYAFVTKHEEDEAVADLERWFVEEEAASYAA